MRDQTRKQTRRKGMERGMDNIDTARELWQKAYQLQLAGNIDSAIQLYQQSIELHPTSEAHTYLGWAYSMQKRYEDAIAECLRAIACDTDYGNPYNDIGSYLIELGRYEEAIAWLNQAMKAPRYESRALPHMNLARIYLHQNKVMDAIGEFREAYRQDDAYLPALHAYQTLLARLN